PLIAKVVYDNADAPHTLLYQIHASSIKEMLEYCRSIDQPKLFRYVWSNWYRPELKMLRGRQGSDATIPISSTTMRLESHWRIFKKD
ncbi:hypothetical protein V1515DRAFT_529902, partial [Lipomyces mesembrius]